MRKLATSEQNPDLFKMKATCTGAGWDQGNRCPCYSLWEVTAKDIQRRTHTDYGGNTDTYYGFTCPDCGCFTELDKDDIPFDIRANAKNYSKISNDNSDR